MNIYFLVEGRRTEKKVYPKWISILIPELTEINNAFLVDKNNFYIFSGNGYPSLLNNHLRNSIEEINAIKKFDYFVICLDADEVTVKERINEVKHFIKKEKININSKTKIEIVVQNRCIETWFLANPKVYKRNPSNELLKEFNDFYNVSINDPELMGKFEGFETHSVFHEVYLSEMLSERNIQYSKKNPRGVIEPNYLKELIKRASNTDHIQTFRKFIDFCEEVKNNMK